MVLPTTASRLHHACRPPGDPCSFIDPSTWRTHQYPPNPPARPVLPNFSGNFVTEKCRCRTRRDGRDFPSTTLPSIKTGSEAVGWTHRLWVALRRLLLLLLRRRLHLPITSRHAIPPSYQSIRSQPSSNLWLFRAAFPQDPELISSQKATPGLGCAGVYIA